MLLVIDGPEKAGKTTLCRVLERELGFRYRHWDRPVNDLAWLDPAYARILMSDILSGDDVVWDRSWASDWVYGQLLKDGRDSDPTLREWIFGRAAKQFGHRLMLLGPGGELQFGRRTPDDHPVDPFRERELYRQYAERWGWRVLVNEYTDSDVDHVVSLVRTARLQNRRFRNLADLTTFKRGALHNG